MHLPQSNIALSKRDRAIIKKAKKALKSAYNGYQMKDVIDDAGIIEALGLLVRITTEDELHSLDVPIFNKTR